MNREKTMKTFKTYLEAVKETKKCLKCGSDTKKTMNNHYGTTFKCSKCGFKLTYQKNPETGKYVEEMQDEDEAAGKEEKMPKDIEERLFDFFSTKQTRKDPSVHNLAESLGVDPDDVEEVVYKLLQSFLSAGKFFESGKKESDFDPKEIEIGIKVEMEHTNNPKIAKRIALDHIVESLPVSYYTKLAAMEKEIENEKNNNKK